MAGQTVDLRRLTDKQKELLSFILGPDPLRGLESYLEYINRPGKRLLLYRPLTDQLTQDLFYSPQAESEDDGCAPHRHPHPPSGDHLARHPPARLPQSKLPWLIHRLDDLVLTNLTDFVHLHQLRDSWDRLPLPHARKSLLDLSR